MSDSATAKKPRIYTLSLAAVYPLYQQKVERKGRSAADVDTVVLWLTGYDEAGLRDQLERRVDLETFFRQAPQINPNAHLITGRICGVRVEEIEDDITRQARYLDKLVDEVAQGRAMEKILRS